MRTLAPLTLALLLIVVPCTLAAEAAGDSAAAAQARADTIAPFIDPLTVLVVRIDMTKIDADAAIKQIEDWQNIAIKDPKELRESVADMKRELQLPKQLLRDFRQAGGKDFYVLCSLANVPMANPFFVVAPLEPGANAEALTAAVQQIYRPDKSPASQQSASASWHSVPTAQISGAIVADADGMTIKRLKVLEPAAQPQLQAAFEALPGAGLQVAVIASPDMRAVLAAMLPLNDEDPQHERIREMFQTVIRGAQWGAAGVDLPPQTRLRLAVQTGDPSEARQVLAAIKALCNLGIEEATAQDEGRKQTLRTLAQALLPAEPQGDKLVQAIANDQISKILTQVAPPLALARVQAKKRFSMNNLGQWGRALHIYYGEKKAWADDFLQLMTIAMRMNIKPTDPLPDILANPQRPKMRPAYVYIKPGLPMEKIANPGAMVVFYERYDNWDDGISVALLDGHVQFIKDQAEFEKMLAQTRAMDPGGTVVVPAAWKGDPETQKPQADAQKSDEDTQDTQTDPQKPPTDPQKMETK